MASGDAPHSRTGNAVLNDRPPLEDGFVENVGFVESAEVRQDGVGLGVGLWDEERLLLVHVAKRVGLCERLGESRGFRKRDAILQLVFAHTQ